MSLEPRQHTVLVSQLTRCQGLTWTFEVDKQTVKQVAFKAKTAFRAKRFQSPRGSSRVGAENANRIVNASASGLPLVRNAQTTSANFPLG